MQNFGPDLAAKTHAGLVNDFQTLVDFPRLGRLRPDITNEALRFFRSGHYYIVYRPGSPLLIHRIVHTARDLLLEGGFAGFRRVSLKSDLSPDRLPQVHP